MYKPTFDKILMVVIMCKINIEIRSKLNEL